MKHKVLAVLWTIITVVSLTLILSCSSQSEPTTSTPSASAQVAPAETTSTTAVSTATDAKTSTSTPSATAEKPSYTLTFAGYHAATTDEAKFCQAFIDDLQTRTNGKVKVDFFPGGSLLAAKNMYDGVQNGIADIGAGSMSYTMGKMPQTEMGMLPIGAASPWIATHAVNDFYNKYTPKEWDKTHVLWLWGNGPAVIMSTKPINTLDDLKGLKIRAQGQCGVIMNLLGSSPQSVAMSEMYDGLSKGVVDGIMVDASVLLSWKLGDVTKYVLNCSEALGNPFVFFVVMNKNTWNELPADIQEIVTELTTEYIDKSGRALNQQFIDGLDYALTQGNEFSELSDSEVDRWRAAVSSMSADKVEELYSLGFTGQEEAYQMILDSVGYWTTQQKAENIPFPFPEK